jgi:c-di-GMP phosphodiesterase
MTVMKTARVKTDGGDVLVAITSPEKPEISAEVLEKWQKILDLAARIVGVPSGLITRLHERDLEVLLASNTEGNVFERQSRFELGLGWYCENVAGRRRQMALPSALKDEAWKNNPSVPFNIISYLGIPIQWPDGEIFGTFCMLDSREHDYPALFADLLASLREIIQEDLKSALLYRKTRDDLLSKEIRIREIHHSVRNHFFLLTSMLNLQSIEEVQGRTVESVLADIQSRITAISMLHESLYRSMDCERVPLGSYLSELGSRLLESLQRRPVAYSWKVEPVFVPPSVSMHCGLILNELVTNSLKYAFTGAEAPAVRLALKKAGGGVIEMTYADNGPGMPAAFDAEKSGTLGMMVVRQSAKQMRGEYRMENDGGFHFTLSFPLPE